MPREILAPLNEADVRTVREMAAAGSIALWAPRHGGGATLTIGGDVVEIEPLGPGWWVSAGHAGSDGVNGTLQEAKVRALEILSGIGDV